MISYNYCSAFEGDLIVKTERNYYDIRLICKADDYTCSEDYASVKNYVNNAEVLKKFNVSSQWEECSVNIVL